MINQRVKLVEQFIFMIDRIRPHISLGDPVYEIAINYVD